MRIWDIHPGYLNRQSLLGEHRELHGIVSIFVNNKKGYSRHPETLRWVHHGWALRIRHQQLACEMALRGFTDRSPVTLQSNAGNWPKIYIDPPDVQFSLLHAKYEGKEEGRIALPENAQQLWSQHKYSVLARDPNLYKEIGQTLADHGIGFADLALRLTETLRQQPNEGGICNAVQHMWGYVSDDDSADKPDVLAWSLKTLLSETQRRAMERKIPYLTASTALSELMLWLSDS